jgi:hypothetical protein
MPSADIDRHPVLIEGDPPQYRIAAQSSNR